MSELNPNNLTTTFLDDVSAEDPIIPRAYTLTHSDATGDLYLSIGKIYNKPQIAGWYTRFMRDEVLAEWQFENEASFHVHCHVSGGILLGSASWRYSIFRRHMRMVLEAFRFGDKRFFEIHPELDLAKIWVHFHSNKESYKKLEDWGQFREYIVEMKQLAGSE